MRGLLNTASRESQLHRAPLKGDQVRGDACEGVPHHVPGEVMWMLSGIACARDLGGSGLSGSVLHFVLLLSHALWG